VVADVLGGDVSPDTRAVLLSGDHPLLASGGSTNSSAAASTGDQHHSGDPYALPAQQPTMTDGSSMADNQMDGLKPANRQAGGGGGGFGGLKPAPQLQGLAQVVGLALGAPEFQRR
jgi:hypothetical protein